MTCKLVLIIAFAWLAGSVRAASVAWNTGAIYEPQAGVGCSDILAGATSGIYSAVVTFYFDNAGSPGGAIAGVTGTTDNTTNVSSALSGITGGYSFANNATYWASVYLIADINGSWYAQSKTVSFAMPGGGNASINFTTMGAWPYNGSLNWCIPEPTTLSLFALGAAALSLRRRAR